MRVSSDKAQLAAVRCESYDGAFVEQVMLRQFSLLGGVEKFVSRGERVLLKPNFIAPKPRSQPAQTDPAVLISLAKLLKDFGAKPFIGDSPAWGDVFACAKALELESQLKKLDVPLVQLNKPRKCFIPESGVNVGISSIALDADKIINVPKLKSHQQLVATIAVKNMFGCVSGKVKAFWHFAKGSDEKKFCKLLIGIYKYLNPVLSIVDGIVAMEGRGPINGVPRQLGFLVASAESIACERFCAKLINISPDELPIIRTAHEIGFNQIDEMDLLGDDIAPYICRDFVRAELVPIRFSLPRVCKSITKQLLRKFAVKN